MRHVAVLARLPHERRGARASRRLAGRSRPFTVSVPIALHGAARAAGRAGRRCSSLNLVLLRPAFAPAADAHRDDAARSTRSRPGERVPVVGGPTSAALAQAFNAMLDRLEAERRESARRALHVQEGERQRIARELHDEVGQTLTAMMLQIESLAGEDRPTSCATSSTSCARRRAPAREDVRRIAQRLRPEALEDLGLQSALVALRDVVRRADRHPRSSGASSATLPLTDEQELVVYRVAQEALTNVARHAERHARRAAARPDATARWSCACATTGAGLPAGARRPRTASAACASARC